MSGLVPIAEPTLSSTTIHGSIFEQTDGETRGWKMKKMNVSIIDLVTTVRVEVYIIWYIYYNHAINWGCSSDGRALA